MEPIARDWTIIRVYADETNYCYISLYTPDFPLNEEADIELDNDDGSTDIIYAGDFEVVAKMTEKDADEFIAQPIAWQDQFLVVK